MITDVLCIGNASYDIYFPVPAYPEEDEKYVVEEFLEACGGPASNAAFLLGLWGVQCGFGGLVGDDEYGRTIAEEFRKIGVDTELLEARNNHDTPLSCVITNATTGSRTILNRQKKGAGMTLDGEVLAKKGPHFLLFDGHEYAASLEALRLFPEAVSILDAGSLRPETRVIAGKVTHLLCSGRFAFELAGLSDAETDAELISCSKYLIKLNPNPGCFTLGSRGLVYWEKDNLWHLRAFPVKAVDTTAAGDIFHGAFLFSLIKGRSFPDSLIFGSAAAAVSTERPGGRSSVPPVKEVENFLTRQKNSGTFPVPRRLR